MTAVIKCASANGVPGAIQAFASLRVGTDAAAVSHEDILRGRIAEVEAEIARRAELLPTELAEARAQASREALETRSDAEDRALEALSQTLRKAQSAWLQQLQSWEGLAIGVARAVLEQVFSNPNDRLADAASAIRHRLNCLEASSVVRVRVSSDDFGDPDQLRSAARGLGVAVELVSDAGVQSGDCVIDLRLGHVDVGIPAQWTRISGLLERLESEAANP